MEKKVAIFDLDGTLIDAYVSIRDALNYTLGKLGYPEVSLQKAKYSVGGGDMEFALKMVREDDADKFLEIYRDNYLNFIEDGLSLMAGCEELLYGLKKRGTKIAAATNRSGYALVPMLKKLKIDGYFDILYSADDVKEPKPSPEILLKVLTTFKAEAGEVFFVGDMDIDLLTGQNAGIDTYIVVTGSSPAKVFDKFSGARVFNNLVELNTHLFKNNF